MISIPRTLFSIGSRNAFSLNVGLKARPVKLFSPTSLLQLRGYRPPPRFHQFQPRNLRHRFNNIRWGELVYPALFTGAFCAITPYILPYIVDSIPALKRNPSLVTIPIIGINVGIFFAHRLPRLLPLLRKYFLLVNARPFSVWSMLGSGFSHQSFTHLFFNMFCFQSFAPALCGVLGPSTFLLVYLGSIVCSSFASLAFRTISLSLVILSLGASGGIFGILGVFSYLFPNAGVALFFIPVPGGAWMLFLASFAFNVAGLFYRGPFDFAAHIGGSVAGIYYGWRANEERKKRRRRRIVF
uniref:Peptidase S54 rhomboid domain-containing protein n=1 Tax=Candidozyma auris TaxID=498019 RepID=A0A0L0P2F8_CANAR